MTNINHRSHKFATTFVEGFRDTNFSEWARLIEVPPKLDSLSKREFRIMDELILFSRVIKAAFREKALLLFSSRGRLKPELNAVILTGLFPKKMRPKILIYGEMFEPNPGIRMFFERIFMHLVDRVVDLHILFSNEEINIFSATWGINKEKLRVCHQFYFPPERSRNVQQHNPNGVHIFAGGNSFRDYDALIKAAAQMPEREFCICTTRISNTEELPPNVKVSWPPLQEYLQLIDTAAAIVIPIQMGLKRTAGLLTCFESMWLGKIIIVPKSTGLEDYIQDKVTGLLVDGTPQCYADTINWVLDPENTEAINRIGMQARKSIAEQYTLEKYNNRIIALIDEVIEAS